MNDETNQQQQQQLERNKIMNFGEAQQLIMAGGKAARKGWNGKGMYIFYITDWNFNQIGDAQKLPFTALKTADNKIVPWTVSQTDAHANDWEVAI